MARAIRKRRAGLTFLLTILGYVALIFFGWIALYVLVFTASLAWHLGTRAELRNRNKDLRRLSERLKRAQSELKQVLNDEIERQETVH